MDNHNNDNTNVYDDMTSHDVMQIINIKNHNISCIHNKVIKS